MATHMPMAAARQPFAPLNGARLQNLTSLKNRQNALPAQLSSPSKRKATSFLEDDSENIDPIIFLSPKRSKGQDGLSKDTPLKPAVSQFFLTPTATSTSSPLKPVKTDRPMLQARAPAPKLNTAVSKSTPLSAPAGRSPTRKRIGILNRRRTGSPFMRVDPPKFSQSTGLNFSIDAALSGTIPSYSARQAKAAPATLPVTLHEPVAKDSWFFEIHEDTEEELATNLMEHSTCTLDISSDEESAARLKDERGKENVPPMDDISQTSTASTTASASMSKSRQQKNFDEGAIELDRSPLGEMLAEDFYAEGCDKESVAVVPADVAPEEEPEPEQQQAPSVAPFDFSAKVEIPTAVADEEVEALMTIKAPVEAALLAPIEKAEEGFEVWESGSAKGDD
ncbi:hypothetical protein BP6252_00369 [Coleophoma cylindrospora]|uniref:Thymidylate kinase n=1 Tax=Coleophoma cylindrospora TaxID=1849047 RepID=A0A3D8SPW4_9HELO|nr:hypothetical protein BP6252_00369 [Coleophoma cylindrospora]